MAENQNNVNGKDLLIGTLVGSIIGAATALLLAPKAGRETRSDLNRQWITVRDKTQEVGRSVSGKAKEVGATVKNQSNEMIGKIKDTQQNVKEDMSELKDQGKESVGEVAAAVEKAANETVEQVKNESDTDTTNEQSVVKLEDSEVDK